ncbi:hypothetical protein PG996_016115 [Apiospora saccharicola]|uniref:lytic cellulose monooxygenase (C4-dehydrogenating) n=1 Tax=Apiospora saccharicola TaxID=335842 RepID=A0ABR1TQB9_9PEZI
MKSIAAAVLLASAASAHYTFPALIHNGQKTGDWEYVRKTENFQSHGPIQDVTSPLMTCYASGNQGAKTLSVSAGDTVGFTIDPAIQHPGPMQYYLAKAPSGQTADSFDGKGNVWFKIYQDGPKFGTGVNGLSWPSDKLTTTTVKIPTCVSEGAYLLRVEHIGLHSASSVGGAQFYLACAQLNITSSGTKSPAGVALPGAYKATDPGIEINLYYPLPTSYTNPGPAVMTC